MIVLFGIPSEPPIVMLKRELERLSVPCLMFNQRSFSEASVSVELEDGHMGGQLGLGGRKYRLEDFRGIYIRLMDDRFLPELDGEAPDSAKRRQCRALHSLLLQWIENASARVVNRPSAMASNSSKPFQAQLIAEQGFEIPETLITNDPDLVGEFADHMGKVVYKSISGARSIVQTLSKEDLERLEDIRWCPTQFQEFIEGDEIRVHVVGESVFATSVKSKSVDYRYAQRQGFETVLERIEIDLDLRARCLQLSRALGMAFVGIDLRITPQGDAYCFEVNPSPAFSYYEVNTGQPIAAALAAHLAGVS